MQTTVEKVSETKLKIHVAVSVEILKQAREHAVRNLGKNVKVTGFREGKAPAHLIEKNIDQGLLQSEFIEEAINHSYPEAVTKENIRPVLQPQISLTKFVPFSTVEYTAEVEILGEVKLADYKKIKKVRPVAEVTDEEVAKVIENMQRQMAEKTEVDRAAKTGDEVWIDFEGTDEKGEPVSGASGTDYPLALGSNTFIPGFEDNLVGLKTGEKKSFTLTFPKDYGVKAMQGRKVTFACTVKNVKEVTLPKVDDEFVKKVSPVKTVKELKEDVKQQLSIEKQRQSDNDFEAEVINEVTDKSEVTLPEGLVNEQVEIVLNELKQNLTYRGMTFPEYLENNGMTEEQQREKEILPEAKRRLKAGLVLSEISEREKIMVTEEELEVRLQALKDRYKNDPQMMAELDKPENRRDITARLLTEKTIVMLVDQVTKK